MNEQQVIGRLELGREVAAEVTAEAKGNRAFVFVIPSIDESVGVFQDKSDSSEPIAVRTKAEGRLISSFKVRYRELRPGFEAEPDDWDKYRYSDFVVDCASIEGVREQLRKRWNLGLEELLLPHDVDHPYAGKPKRIVLSSHFVIEPYSDYVDYK